MLISLTTSVWSEDDGSPANRNGAYIPCQLREGRERTLKGEIPEDVVKILISGFFSL
jgi:hypothetical protein